MNPRISEWDAHNPEYLGRLCGQMFQIAEALRDWHFEYYQTSEFMKHFVYQYPNDWPTMKKTYYAACHQAKGNVMELDERRRDGDDFLGDPEILYWLLRVRQSRNRMHYRRMNKDIAQVPVGGGHTVAIFTRQLDEMKAVRMP